MKKWKETHLIDGSYNKHSLFFLFFLYRVRWAIDEFISFIFFSSQIPPNQIKC